MSVTFVGRILKMWFKYIRHWTYTRTYIQTMYLGYTKPKMFCRLPRKVSKPWHPGCKTLTARSKGKQWCCRRGAWQILQSDIECRWHTHSIRAEGWQDCELKQNMDAKSCRHPRNHIVGSASRPYSWKNNSPMIRHKYSGLQDLREAVTVLPRLGQTRRWWDTNQQCRNGCFSKFCLSLQWRRISDSLRLHWHTGRDSQTVDWRMEGTHVALPL